MEDLAARVIAAAQELLEARVGAGHPLLVAVSGGGDSMALLEVISSLQWTGETIVAVYDHGARPESAEDTSFVRARAGQLGLPCEVGRSPSAGSSRRAEQELRVERYDYLAAVARRHEAVLLTGHTADDQAESVLAQLLRGAGPSGLRGVAVETTWPAHGGTPVRVLRPLLQWRRLELRDLLVSRGQHWRDDPTNRDGSNLRGRLREEVMPLLAEVSGRDPVTTLSRLAQLAAVWLEDLDSRLPEAPSTSELAALPDALLFRWLHRLGCPGHDHVEWAAAAIRSGRPSRRALPGLSVLEVRPDHVVIVDGSAPQPEVELPSLSLIPCPAGLPRPPPEGSCYLDAARTPRPLRVRSRRAGDRYHPVGIPGTKLVSDVLTDLKVPAAARDAVPLVVTPADEIVWIAPYGLDRRFAATQESRDVVEVRLTEGPIAS